MRQIDLIQDGAPSQVFVHTEMLRDLRGLLRAERTTQWGIQLQDMITTILDRSSFERPGHGQTSGIDTRLLRELLGAEAEYTGSRVDPTKRRPDVNGPDWQIGPCSPPAPARTDIATANTALTSVVNRVLQQAGLDEV